MKKLSYSLQFAVLTLLLTEFFLNAELNLYRQLNSIKYLTVIILKLYLRKITSVWRNQVKIRRNIFRN